MQIKNGALKFDVTPLGLLLANAFAKVFFQKVLSGLMSYQTGTFKVFFQKVLYSSWIFRLTFMLDMKAQIGTAQ